MIENTTKPKTPKYLINTYDLVSKATNSESMTLYRVTESFPKITCLYLPICKNLLISFAYMKAVTENYLKIMMTSAFAYLIPNKMDTFCLLLKEAHMAYKFTLYFFTRSVELFDDDYEPDNILQYYRLTHSAIIRSHIPYNEQITFLEKHHLITINNIRITVAENVQEVADRWKTFCLRLR